MKSTLGRRDYLLRNLMMIPVYVVSMLAMVYGGNLAGSGSPLAGLALIMVAAATSLTMAGFGFVFMHKRLKDVFVNTDMVLVWGIFLLSSLITGGVISLALYFLPTKTYVHTKKAA